MTNDNVNLDWLEKLQPTDRTLTEVADNQREVTKQAYGRLLTEEEVILLVEEAKDDLRSKGEI